MHIFIPDYVENILKTLEKAGYEAYIVGGCVRDSLLGKAPDDFDITTSALPEEIQRLFKKTTDTGIKHGTIGVKTGTALIEVTTYRSDSTYSDHRRPDKVSFVSNIKEDLSRRDFTINAMAYNPVSGIIDYHSGINDLDMRILRTVGDPKKRFSEDALRILRFFRFGSVLDFSLDSVSLKTALNLAGDIKNISVERIFSELQKLLCGHNPEIIEPLIKTGELSFLRLNGCESLKDIKKLPASGILRLYRFLELCSSDKQETLSSLKASNKQKKYCSDLDEIRKAAPFKDKIALKNALNAFSIDNIRDYFLYEALISGSDVSFDENMLEEIIELQEPYKICHLKVDGRQLLKIGIDKTEIGKILEQLRLIVAENPQKNNRQFLLNTAKQFNNH